MDKNETKVLAFTALGIAGLYGLSRAKSKRKRAKKKKAEPPITELGEKELYDEGLGYSELLESDVQWRLIQQGDLYGWEWDEIPEDEEAVAQIGDSPINIPSADEALASLIAAIELGNITHPTDVPIPKPEPGEPEADVGPQADSEPDDIPMEAVEIDYTTIPTFPLGEGSEVRHHARPPEGEIYTIIMVREYVTLEGMGLGSWVTDWWAWRAGVELYKARAVLSGRAPNNVEAFDEAAEEIDASTPVFEAAFIVAEPGIEVYPIGSDPTVLPALADPQGLIVSGDCQVAGIGPGFWEAVGGRVEEVVGGGADSVADVMTTIVPEFFPPVDIDACAGVSAVHNLMLGRVEQYLEETLGE